MNEIHPLVIRLHPTDNVAVAIAEIPSGTAVTAENITCRSAVPAGHKVAVKRIPLGDPVVKYGQTIGFASRPIEPGDHVHVHNVVLHDFARDYGIGRDARPTEYLPLKDVPTFQGFVRPDGRTGTRNFIGVIATVSCSASVVQFIADRFTSEELSRYPNIDGVVAIKHGAGCAMAGEGFDLLQRTLAGWIRHPNFAAVILVGLGCEGNHLECLSCNMNLKESETLRMLNIQDEGGTEETVRLGVEIVREMLPRADEAHRTPVPAGELVVALECGGSDGYSGITANPVLGAAADWVVRSGGTSILAETPEIYGAEHLLTRRAASPRTAEKLIERIRWWEEYTRLHGAEINNNPSPGNKAGGLTTILEKSLGAAAKGGTTDLVEVYRYAEPVTAKGLIFMDTPGYDVVSVTGMIAGGANVAVFTTGRGSVCGFKPVPTIKLCSNTATYRRMSRDMDVNCGAVLDGDTGLEALGEEVFRLIVDTASGKKTKSELLGFGDNEFVPWHLGPVM